ncbi:MAG: PQQ-like beta-propeller repeat protein [Phycisphaerales bacterium]|nr:MAG: PQQ-like beta-propeller repeat protein [Phycisphaerales bacterium]
MRDFIIAYELRSRSISPMRLRVVVALVLISLHPLAWANPPSAVRHSQSLHAAGLIATPEPDWAQWRGPRRDGISDETGLLQQWPEGGPKLIWTIDELGKGWSSPIIVGETLYITGDVGEDLVIYAFGLDGTPRWKTTNGRYWRTPYPGARACVAHSEGKLYHMNAHGRVACLEAATGKEIWAVNILERFEGKNIRWALSECLLVDGPRVIVTPGGKKALMAALDKRTGDTVWTAEPLAEDTSHCSPILFRAAGRRQIANCSAGHGFGVDADTGELLWTVPVKNKYGTNIATPLYDSGRVFFMTPYDSLGQQYELAADGRNVNAEPTWKSFIDSVTGCAVLVDGTLLAAGYEKQKWWFGIDWETGRTKYELKDFTTGAALYADGRLYVMDLHGAVGLLEPTAEGLKVRGRFQLVEKRVQDAFAHPVVFAGRLYLRYHDTLYCYDVRQR